MSEIVRYGVLFDTHGSLSAKVLETFEGVRRLYHCGDLGSQNVALELEALARCRAVSGNMDAWPNANYHCLKGLRVRLMLA